MKRLITLFVAMCLVVGGAVEALAQSGFAQKTRYVYLWDVTASTKNKKVENRCFFDIMADFLEADIAKKEDGTEIIIVPFNECSKSDGYSIRFVKGNKRVAEIIDEGNRLVDDHKGAYNDSANKFYGDNHRKIKNGERLGNGYLGFTDIAGALKAMQSYVDPNYNTIFILLTDCGQEYIDDEVKIVGGNKESKDYLSQEIKNFNRRLCEIDDKKSYNRLFYVIVDDKDDPTTNDPSLANLEKINFIPQSNGSIMLYFEQLKVTDVKAPVSYLDKTITIEVEGIQAKSILHKYQNIKVNVSMEYYDKDGNKYTLNRNNVKLDTSNSLIKIEGLDFKSEAVKLNRETIVDCTVILTDETNKFYEGVKDCHIRVWLKPNKATAIVTKDFAPTLRVKKH